MCRLCFQHSVFLLLLATLLMKTFGAVPQMLLKSGCLTLVCLFKAPYSRAQPSACTRWLTSVTSSTDRLPINTVITTSGQNTLAKSPTHVPERYWSLSVISKRGNKMNLSRNSALSFLPFSVPEEPSPPASLLPRVFQTRP